MSIIELNQHDKIIIFYPSQQCNDLFIQQLLYNHLISTLKMSLLSNLLQFSNMEVTSLLMCESPKVATAALVPKEPRVMSSLQKQEQQSPERRVASKSLSKMNLFSGTKIDPRERLLHRLVHKLQMKKRKHYYHFFVVLENLKKNNVYRCVKTPQIVGTATFLNGIAKIAQLEQILYSKYFERVMKKVALVNIKKQARGRAVINQIQAIVRTVRLEQYFRAIVDFAKNIEREEIRMEILVASMKSIKLSSQKKTRSDGLAEGFQKIRSASLQVLLDYKQRLLEQFKTSYETVGQKDVGRSEQEKQLINSVNQFCSPSPQVIKTAEYISNSCSLQLEKIIPGDNSGKEKIQWSPMKHSRTIALKIQQRQLKKIKYTTYMQSYSIKTDFQEQTLEAVSCRETPFKVAKRCEPDPICVHQISDIYDKNIIFYSQNFMRPRDTSTPISESAVRSVCGDFNNQGPIEENIHFKSHFHCTAPLRESFACEQKANMQRSAVRGNSFGFEAVNFKNSMVSEREGMKHSKVVQNVREKKNSSFMKMKNFIRLQKDAWDNAENQIFERLVNLQFRNDSSDKNLAGSKFRKEAYSTCSKPESVHHFASAKQQTRKSDNLRKQINNNERKNVSLTSTSKLNGSKASKKVNPSFIKLTRKSDY